MEGQESSIEDVCNHVRNELKELENDLRVQMNNSRFQGEESYQHQHSEMLANMKLAVQHIEDARMRCGKVLQFNGDGVSIYDKARQA